MSLLFVCMCMHKMRLTLSLCLCLCLCTDRILIEMIHGCTKSSTAVYIIICFAIIINTIRSYPCSFFLLLRFRVERLTLCRVACLRRFHPHVANHLKLNSIVFLFLFFSSLYSSASSIGIQFVNTNRAFWRCVEIQFTKISTLSLFKLF